jgi:hypothetical protein
MPKLVALAVGVGLVATGLWAFADPGSFYRTVAEYPPYNEHLFHDIGAFLLGLGAALVAGAFVTDALLLALGANAVAAVLHAVSHVIDRDLGGRAVDPWSFSGLAVLLVVATAVRWQRRS